MEHWPEIFDEIEIKAIPLQYVKAVNVKFLDGTIWVVEIKNTDLDGNSAERLEDELELLFEQYDDVIDCIDFNLDTKKVKNDISARTRRFIKKRK